MGLIFRSHVYLSVHGISLNLSILGAHGLALPLVAESPMRSVGLARKTAACFSPGESHTTLLENSTRVEMEVQGER